MMRQDSKPAPVHSPLRAPTLPPDHVGQLIACPSTPRITEGIQLMLTSIASFLITRGVPMRWAKPLIYLLLAVMPIAAALLAKPLYDNPVIETTKTRKTEGRAKREQ